MADFDLEWAQRRPRKPVLNEADPIWGETATIHDTQMGGWLVESDRSGEYLCSPELRGAVANWSPDDKAKLTTWITDQIRAGVSFPAVSPDVLLRAVNGKPLRFSAKVDRFFEYLRTRSHRAGDSVYPGGGLVTSERTSEINRLMRWIEAINEAELRGFINALLSEGLILIDNGGRHTLSAKGLMRLDAIDQAGAATDQAFVAMWFDASVTDAFEHGISPGLADAGYRAFRIDRKEHANKIDDEIIAEIRRSRFVVADFTSGTFDLEGNKICVPRGGVYYEAGFAQGLGMPVIWTVRADQINDVHFDIRQFNQIVWNDAADLREKLTRRVLAVLGYFGQNARPISI